MEIAKETAASLKSAPPPFLVEVEVTPPGYLNFRMDWPGLAKLLISQIAGEKGVSREHSPVEGKVFIEHTSVNPNKAMHIGHLRNAVLGDTVARVFRWLGYPVEVCNYIDDTGLQVVDVVTAFLHLDPPSYPEGSEDFSPFWEKAQGTASFDYFCWDIYTRFQREVQRNPDLAQKREGVLHQIEKGDSPVAFFAKELASRIVQAHLDTVARLSIFYDLLNWESDILRGGFWKAAFRILSETGALRFEKEGPNEGCWVVPFGGLVETEEGVKSLDKILVRSNGSVTYTGKDIAYQLWKFGLLKEDFHYKMWGPQANGKALWTTVPERTSSDAASFGHADRLPSESIDACFKRTPPGVGVGPVLE
jgi:arginyl-tRNA synthetase